MAGTSFKVDTELGDLDKLDRIPKEARDVLLDTNRLFDEFVEPTMRSFVQEVYAEQGGPTGTRWQGYDRSGEYKYKQFKKSILDMENIPRGNQPGGLMRWGNWGDHEERLYPSLTNPNHPDHVWEKNKLSAKYGTEVPYAERLTKSGVNQFGESRPARPLLTMADQWKASMMTGIEQWYKSQLKARVGIDLGGS